MKRVAAIASRKLVTDAPHIDGVIKEILSEISCSSKVSPDDGEEYDMEKGFNMFD